MWFWPVLVVLPGHGPAYRGSVRRSASPAPVKWGAAGFPTAFVATYGTEAPVIGFDAGYDALPGPSQKKGATVHDPLVYNYDVYGPAYGAGHGDARNALGAGGTAAAITAAQAIRASGLKATVKLFGSAGEEPDPRSSPRGPPRCDLNHSRWTELRCSPWSVSVSVTLSTTRRSP
ncbi:hypothetical protein ACFC09_01565 [Streptomyces sp. NPDC056161]|uniref:hypothetical protein n=1 Tax=Streptomyces sp. NPDC056161 TaxID=3345732 RepID=UPI0035E0ABF9